MACSSEAYAQATVSAQFSKGAIAEYTNGANRTSNGKLFGELGISSIEISQNSSNGAWGGSQGNDTAVTMKIAFNDGRPSVTFTGAINWVKNAGGSEFDWVGITTNAVPSDGYTPSAGASRTYILQFKQSGLDLAALAPDGLDGSANTGQALDALNRYFPATPLSFTGANGSSGGSPAYSFDYAENRASGTALGSVAATGGSGTRSYGIAAGNQNGWFAIDASTGAISLTAAGAASLANDFEQAPNVQALTVRVSDATSSASIQVSLNETDIAETPLVFTGTNGTDGGNPAYRFDYAENRASGATLGSVASTGGTGPRTYSIVAGNPDGWYAIDAGSGAISLTAAGAASPANDFEQAPNLQALTVRVSDAASSAMIQVSLGETDVADSPLVFTGTNGTSGGNPAYSFDYAENRASGATIGSVASAGGAGPRTYAITAGDPGLWFAIDQGSGAIALTAAGAASLANDFEQAPNLRTLIVQVSDGTSASSIEVSLHETNLDDAGPAITGPGAGPGAPASAVGVDEQQTSVATLKADETVTWSIVGGLDAGRFTIGADGTIAFAAAPDFEQPADSGTDNEYEIIVQAVDGAGNASTQAIVVTVLDLDDSGPAITGPSGGPRAPGSAISVDEEQTSVARLTAGEPVTWSIVGGLDAARFAIGGDGTITFVAAPDHENPADSGTDNEYEIIVQATDAAGNASTQAIVVTVIDLDEGEPAVAGPVITGPSGGPGAPSSAVSVDEGQTRVARLTSGGPVTWSLIGGDDSARFAIGADGAITFIAAPDYEKPGDRGTDNEYDIVVQATDAAGNVSSQAITVTVLDLDDSGPRIAGPSGAPGAPSSSVTVDEGQSAVARLSAGEAVTWSVIGGPDAAMFTIGSDGSITFAAAPDYDKPADSGADNEYEIIVQAADAAGNVSTQAIIINVLDLDDTPPVIGGGPDGPPASLSVNEGQTSVASLTAGEPVTWSLVGGADAARFTIAPNGAIAFTAAPDYEKPGDSGTDNEYEIIVQAADGAGNVTTQAIMIAVLDLDDTGPAITGPNGGPGSAASAVSIDEGQVAVARLTAGEPVAWSLIGGADASRFTIDGDGTVSFIAAPDHERPADSGADNVYQILLQATDAAGNVATHSVTVTVLDLDDTVPVIAGLSGGAGDAGSAVSVSEGETSVARLTAGEPVAWSLIGGADAAAFTIGADGSIAFTAAPDFERPGDRGSDNLYEIAVQARDLSGNVATRSVAVTVLDLDDTAPVIAGSGGAAGAGGFGFSVDEGQAPVARLSAGEPVTWSIVGGPDANRFALAADGTITFIAAPDYERPGDLGSDNEYEIIVEARDGAGNVSIQAIIVTVADLDDTAPAIAGAGAPAGAATSTVSVAEGQTAVVQLTAGEPVTWSITGGADASSFTIAPNGSISFAAAPDYEQPADSNADNSYLVEVRAVDQAGNEGRLTLIVNVTNVDELTRKLDEIGGRLRGSLRGHAFDSLHAMLAFNEGLVQQGSHDSCAGSSLRSPVTGSVHGSAESQSAALNYSKRLNACDARLRLFGDAGVAVSRNGGEWTLRTFGAVRAETRLRKGLTVGIGMLASAASEGLAGFADSEISDRTVQVNVYGRARLTGSLRAGAFAGFGEAWYEFRLEDEGLLLQGQMSGWRHILGASLAGDLKLAGKTLTTELVLSRAKESLNSATLAAAYGGESRKSLAFPVGAVDATRLSLPVHVPFVIKKSARPTGSNILLALDSGLLCEDASADASKLACGYQLGAKLNFTSGARHRGYASLEHEAVSGNQRYLLSVGYARSFGPRDALELGVNVGRSALQNHQDYRAMVQLRGLRF
jgi:hypothetical protein